MFFKNSIRKWCSFWDFWLIWVVLDQFLKKLKKNTFWTQITERYLKKPEKGTEEGKCKNTKSKIKNIFVFSFIFPFSIFNRVAFEKTETDSHYSKVCVLNNNSKELYNEYDTTALNIWFWFLRRRALKSVEKSKIEIRRKYIYMFNFYFIFFFSYFCIILKLF